MDKPKLEDLLTVHATGHVTVKSEVTGKETTRAVEAAVEVPSLVGLADLEVGTTSVELEASRNLDYNKISVRVFATSKCRIGDEQNQALRLLKSLHEVVESYSDITAGELLKRWESDKRGR